MDASVRRERLRLGCLPAGFRTLARRATVFGGNGLVIKHALPLLSLLPDKVTQPPLARAKSESTAPAH